MPRTPNPVTNLKILLLNSEYTQNEIAAECGMHASQLSKYSLGREQIPIKHLRALCDFFGVPQDELLGLYERQR